MAETLTVTNTADSGPGSLRQAMLSATASTQASTILFAPSANGVITLASPLPGVQVTGGDLTIAGNGAANTVIDGAGLYRPFKAEWQSGLRFTLRGLTVRNGFANEGQGGAILVQGGNSTTLLTLDAVEIVGNRATYNGGAVYVSTPVLIDDSLFAGNRSDTYGGGIHFDGGQAVRVRNTTFDGNVGGVICLSGSGSTNDPVARFVNVTATGDRQGDDAVLRIEGAARASLSNSLIGGSIPSIRLHDIGAVELSTSFNNVLGDPANSGFQSGVNGNRVHVSLPLLGPLGDHGGSTRTRPLLPGSPALDAGTSAGGDIPASDQRGVARVGPPDVGAFESRGFSGAIGSGNGQSTAVGTPFAEPLTVAVVATHSLEPVAGGIARFSAPASGPSAVFSVSDAVIGADGVASAVATANGVAGGPYAVTARLSATQKVDFSLSNLAGVCGAFAFPYTLAGSDNTARVAELRQAIECANVNTTDDAIDLGGHTLAFSDAPYANADGATALPRVAGVLLLRNGTLERSGALPFRFVETAAGSDLTLRGVHLRNGRAATDGGAILAHGKLLLRDAVFEDNRAASHGGAVAARGVVHAVTSQFRGNAAPNGAAIAGWDMLFFQNLRVHENGDENTVSVLWSDAYAAMLTSLFSGNHLSAAGSSLMVFTENSEVAEMRHLTIADNSVAGDLLSIRNGSNVQVRNSILWDNRYGGLGFLSPRNSILPGVPAVAGNQGLPPGFVGAGDYRLDSGSPAIDAADNSYGAMDAFDLDENGVVNEFAPDLDRNPRPLDDAGVLDVGSGVAPIGDIGAYERQAASVAAGVAMSPTSGLVTTEAGGTASFEVVLTRYPRADVVMSLSSSHPGEGVVVPSALVFTQENWNQPRTVTVVGIDDGVVDGDRAYTIVTAALVSDDPAYNGIDPPDVAVVNLDDEGNAFTVGGSLIGLSGSGLALSLNGSETLALATNGRFTFATTLAAGDRYAVAVASPPQAPEQTCVVVNGSGTIGSTHVGDVTVNCGAATTYAVGGLVTGLSGGGLVLQLNGGGDLAIAGDGPFVFAPRLVDGASYLVTVKSQPQGQLCTLANSGGTVQGADVGSVGVSCAPLLANLHLAIDDGHAYSRYGQMRDYFVTLANTGNATADGVAVAAAFSAAFDLPNLRWTCLDSRTGCAVADGEGGFDTLADVPASGSVTWIVSVPIRGDSGESDATATVTQAASRGVPADSSDTNTLVIFRDGLDVPYGDGAEAVISAAARVLDGEAATIEWPSAGQAAGIHSVQSLQTPAGRIAVQRLTWRGVDRVRLLGIGAPGDQRASAWVPVAPDARLAAGYIAVAADAGIVLLEGATRPLALPLGETRNHGEVE